MMTQMAPMLEMMKAKMGKRRFAMLMQTMGPMMSRMMENGGGGLGGMMGGGGSLSGGNFGGGFGAPNYGGYTPMGEAATCRPEWAAWVAATSWVCWVVPAAAT